MIPTIDLLSGLQDFISLLAKIRDHQISRLGDSEVVQTVSLRYDTVTLKLDIRENQNESNRSLSLYLECTFRINGQKATCMEVYCKSQDLEKELKGFILQHTPAEGYAWNTRTKASRYSQEVLRYLDIADEIAKKGYLCSAGDDYRPGYFSEIIVRDKSIVLRQVNHWNSRSIDHKNDYHMRDLEFLIPLHPTEEKKSSIHYNDQIGEMLIHFSDRSSKNNKHCGDAIQEEILGEKSGF